MEWQPISTAPKDGTRVLLYYPEGTLWLRESIVCGCWVPADRHRRPYWKCDHSHAGIVQMRQNPPTHWAPLTPPGSCEPTQGTTDLRAQFYQDYLTRKRTTF